MCPSFEFDSSLSFFLCMCVKEKRRIKKKRAKDASGLTDHSREKDGCDLDRTYVRDKRFVWTSELNWTGRRELIKKNCGRKRRMTSSFETCNRQIFLPLPYTVYLLAQWRQSRD